MAAGSAEPSRRRRGVVPVDLRRRIESLTKDFTVRTIARLVAAQLDGVAPSALTAAEREDLQEVWGPDLDLAGALDVLERAGYGARGVRRPRAERTHGMRREERLKGVVGKLPRALALRLPISADTHREGPNDGTDRWGPVRCSRTLRASHLGLVAALGGLWHRRAEGGEGHVDLTAGELVHLLTGRGRVGGRDVAWVHELLADLEDLDLRADVADRSEQRGAPPGGPPSEAHCIPSTPIAAVERRIGDRWVATSEYAEALAQAAGEKDDTDLVELHDAERASCHGLATIRVHLAEWMRAELTHETRRAVFVNFDVWAHLRPQSQRIYAFLQGHGRDEFDERIYFYLGAPTLYTLGLSGRRDRAAAIVRHDLTAIWHADRRYHDGKGFRAHAHAGTGIPAFAFDAARIASTPTPTALASKSPPKRPAGLRGAIGGLRRHSLLSTRVRGDELDPDHLRRAGAAAARRQAEQVRQSIERSLASASAATATRRSQRDASAPRREGDDDDDADAEAAA
ncbi:MAG: hypothetical protein JSR84_01090 [Proteobacteria bacterium]|nr:hypothetical protein [Pseudomonadota bacterium]